MNSKKLTIIVIIVLLSAFGIFALLLRPVQISGVSMEPMYKNEDRYLAKRFAYMFSLPQRLDVVLYHHENTPEYKIIGRVVGLPSEKIIIKEGKVYLNGTVLSESYLLEQDKTFVENKAVVIEKGSSSKALTLTSVMEEGREMTIPSNSYFVMGDNREFSYDSRVLGFIEKDNIESKVEFKY